MYLSKSFCFALELARLCVRQAFSLPSDFRVVELDFSVNRDHSHRARRAFDMKFALSELSEKVNCYSDVYRRGPKGDWSYGLCYVSLQGKECSTFAFIGKLDEVSLHISPMGFKLNELGLDQDLLEVLAEAGVDSAVKLLGLYEYQVCQIFQPKGPEVMALSNPTEYIDGVTFARLGRLRDKLDQKGYRLMGPRHAPYELQMML